jgi:hypothetical protein
MNTEIQTEVVESEVSAETFTPRFQILDSEELDQVGGGNCVADY